MKIEQQQIGTVDVIIPIGALIDEDAEKCVDVLLKKLKSPNPRVVVGMQEVPYVDSTGLEGLLTATDELADRAMNLKLASVTSTCREIFEMTGISGKFRFFEDVQSAVRSYL